jgi:hypothetical protein
LDNIRQLPLDDPDTEIMIVVDCLLLCTTYRPLYFFGNLENMRPDVVTKLFLAEVKIEFEKPETVGCSVTIHDKTNPDDAILGSPFGFGDEFGSELPVNGERSFIHHGFQRVTLPDPIGST